MAWLIRPIVRVTVVLTVCVLAQAASPQAKQNSAPLPPGHSPDISVAREVRLRKLHLVRPDLIPYLIAYEVCC